MAYVKDNHSLLLLLLNSSHGLVLGAVRARPARRLTEQRGAALVSKRPTDVLVDIGDIRDVIATPGIVLFIPSVLVNTRRGVGHGE